MSIATSSVVPSVGDGVSFPLTPAQLGIWIGQMLSERPELYQTAEAVELRGSLDEVAFLSALEAVLVGAEGLHATIRESNQGVGQFIARSPTVAIEQFDWRRESHPAACVENWMARALNQCAPLEEGPLYRTALHRLGNAHWIWYLAAHHIVLDGYGYAWIQKQVGVAYRACGASRSRPRLPGPAMGALITESRAYEASEAYLSDEGFWRSYLNGRPEPPTLSPRATTLGSVLKACRPLSPELIVNLRRQTKDGPSDLASQLLAIVAEYFFDVTFATSLCIGLPVANRLGSVAMGVPCMAMNIVPLWIDRRSVDSSGSLVRDIQATLARLRVHQRYRYERMRRWTGSTEGGKHLFGPVLNIMEFGERFTGEGLAVEGRTLASGPVEDLAINFVSRDGVSHLQVAANSASYSESDVKRHLDALATRLEAAVSETCGRRSLRESLGSSALVSVATGAPTGGRVVDVLSAIVRQAAERPDAIAVEAEGQCPTSYEGLLGLVKHLASALARRGVSEGASVVLALPRSPEALALKLAVLWVGACFVPVDPAGPPARNRSILDALQPRLIVSERLLAPAVATRNCTLAELLAQDASCAPPPVVRKSSALAYVLFTSGSSGEPRGVEIERSAVDHFVTAAGERYGITERDRVLQFANAWFDASIEEEFVALAAGATLCLRPVGMLDSLGGFVEACSRLRLTVLDLPTAFFHVLAQAVGRELRWSNSVRLIVVGGEALVLEHLRAFQGHVETPIEIVNSYGPTEATVVCTTAQVSGARLPAVASEEPPIGLPLAGVGVAVLDERRNPVPHNYPGQLCIWGPTLARGYLNDPRTTNERFVETSIDGKPRRIYLTGDRCRMDEAGRLWFHGRIDDEVKVSGYRLNPRELERCITCHEGVVDAKVLTRTRSSGKPEVLAFVVLTTCIDSERLLERLGEQLSAPVLPDRIIFVDSFPLNDRGKIDKSALFERAPITTVQEPEALTYTEQVIVDVWREILGTRAITRRSGFFDSGGRSLQVLQVAQRLTHKLGVEILPSQVLQASSVERLAARLEPLLQRSEGVKATTTTSPLQLLHQGNSGLNLFCVHSADCLASAYLGLSDGLDTVNVFGIQARGLTGEQPKTFDELVQDYVELVLAQQPNGPYHLLGWSSGGGIAHAMACRLRSTGFAVHTLALLDSRPAEHWEASPAPTVADALVMLLDDLDASPKDAQGRVLSVEALTAKARAPGSSLSGLSDMDFRRLVDTVLVGMRLYRSAKHPIFEGPVLYFRAALSPTWQGDGCPFSAYIDGNVDVIDVQATHLGLCQREPLLLISKRLQHHLFCTSR